MMLCNHLLQKMYIIYDLHPQIFSSIKTLLRIFSSKMPTFAHSFYFWFSLLYLIVRTLAVSLYSASINDESKKPSEVFRAVPREAWNLEVLENNHYLPFRQILSFVYSC